MQYIVHPEKEHVLRIADEIKNDFFYRWQVDNRTFIVADTGTVAAGMIAYNPKEEQAVHKGPVIKFFKVSYVTCRADYRNRGVASGLLRELFKLAKETGYAIMPGWYEPDGILYIKKKFEQYSREYGVELV